jgi:ParB family transcriptional regulator, chromosome partitioning protein
MRQKNQVMLNLGNRCADDGTSQDRPMILVAGQHRLEALKLLGREVVECSEVADGDLKAGLAEIDENLCREGLTPAQKAAAIARRKEIFLALYPETAAGKSQAKAMNTKLGRGDVSEKCSPTFTQTTAAASGMNRRSVEKAASRGRSIKPEDLEKIVGTSLDKGVELDALAKISADQRDGLIQKAVEGEVVSAHALLKSNMAMTPALGPPRTRSGCASDDEDTQLRNLEAATPQATEFE